MNGEPKENQMFLRLAFSLNVFRLRGWKSVDLVSNLL